MTEIIKLIKVIRHGKANALERKKVDQTKQHKLNGEIVI